MKARHVDQAVSEIAEQLATNVLIIEDEPMIAIDLADLGHQPRSDRASGETTRTHREAVAAVQAQARPGSGRYSAGRWKLWA